MAASAEADGGKAIRASDYFTDEQIKKGKEYRETKYRLFFLREGIEVTILCLFIFSGIAATFGNHLIGITGRWWLGAILFSGCLLALVWLVTFPLSLYSGYFHEHQYGLSNENIGGWLWNYAKGRLVSLVIMAPVGMGLLALIKWQPERWWIYGAICSGILSVVLVFLAPVVIAPLFHSFKPLEEGELKDRVLGLAKEAKLEVEDVLVMDASKRTKKVNAYFTGLATTKRIVLYDTLVEGSKDDEVELVLAHEIGHWKHNHIWKGISLALIGSFLILFIVNRTINWSEGRFGMETIDEVGVLALIFLIVGILGLVGMPVQNAISRYFERQSDWESLTLTDKPDIFIDVEKNLSIKNLSDVEPGRFIKWLLYTHPPVMERIKMALEYKTVKF